MVMGNLGCVFITGGAVPRSPWAASGSVSSSLRRITQPFAARPGGSHSRRAGRGRLPVRVGDPRAACAGRLPGKTRAAQSSPLLSGACTAELLCSGFSGHEIHGASPALELSEELSRKAEVGFRHLLCRSRRLAWCVTADLGLARRP